MGEWVGAQTPVIHKGKGKTTTFSVLTTPNTSKHLTKHYGQLEVSYSQDETQVLEIHPQSSKVDDWNSGEPPPPYSLESEYSKGKSSDGKFIIVSYLKNKTN